ncbi:putative NADH-flavin reductase [Tritrichomonas foetus]|uniref:Putative NADH-flavin reductase n=1 Tax=Tritrichomonas foetus TaxID=1144522 RepID=A0A1J4K4E9_9EUKA|nr:putative NADH-flavin reductase [Tritrichomonas foetus]OHT04374.1 putative NADH-flavin reductase [Tritrichomonas foetus]OHT17393.1 putative NADH-flavin reductase [Tritrichomonas foetus]|eukprot:OHT04373.1 putative NADH-flavin reductase [Tritrichomonas foetus]
MKVAVISANGKAGQLIVKELLSRNVDVTVIVRKENKTETKKSIIKDIFKITYEDLQDFDVIINAFGVFKEEEMEQYLTSSQHLCQILSGKKQRLLIVGGAGSLYTDSTHQIQVRETPTFPDIYKPVSKGAARALEYLRTRKDVRWTYVSPALAFIPDAQRTGKYQLCGDELKLNKEGESMISYSDYAIGIVDEALTGHHIQQRISLVSE